MPSQRPVQARPCLGRPHREQVLTEDLFPEPVAVMSVDVGSESMKIAIVKPGVPMEIVLNK